MKKKSSPFHPKPKEHIFSKKKKHKKIKKWKKKSFSFLLPEQKIKKKINNKIEKQNEKEKSFSVSPKFFCPKKSFCILPKSFLYPQKSFWYPKKKKFSVTRKVSASQYKHHLHGTLCPKKKKHFVHPKKWHPCPSGATKRSSEASCMLLTFMSSKPAKNSKASANRLETQRQFQENQEFCSWECWPQQDNWRFIQ